MPDGLDLHLIYDNYAPHKTPAVKKWLLRHPRFHLHFTPASSSWINLVERWFAELTTRKLRRSAHRSITELEADIRKWVSEWNKNPRPFVWTKAALVLMKQAGDAIPGRSSGRPGQPRNRGDGGQPRGLITERDERMKCLSVTASPAESECLT